MIPFHILVSSTKKESIEEVIASVMSYIKMRNKKEPSTDPCGTPETTQIASDLKPCMKTIFFLFLRKSAIQV